MIIMDMRKKAEDNPDAKILFAAVCLREMTFGISYEAYKS